jgi:hypothetical protein
MCCKVLHIADLDKPAGRWCSHVKPGAGCKIYDDRPGTCRQFFCLWMQDGRVGEEWKPERSRFLVTEMPDGGNVLIAVDPNFANAWRKEPYHATIRRWVSDFAAQGRFIFIRSGTRCLALLPDGERDLGSVGPDDMIAVSRQAGPAGLVYHVEVHPRAA